MRITDSLCCTAETNIALEINYTPVNFFLIVNKKKNESAGKAKNAWVNF